MKDWPTPQYECLPWEYLRPAGRPKKNRRKDPNKASSLGAKKKRRMKCSTCGFYDHNKATCKGPSREQVRDQTSQGTQPPRSHMGGTNPSGHQGTSQDNG
ncbi:hypothetical protein AQUCO_00400195v1 [Aquilegia coerulea]|uniref:Uncharacterized protein n=1 Tax=Aquilegia coerulea TaxID=218851 RepID=A0A2G5ETZ0_AQUCA|nr:hypothetical protein AQUCO_00400195v1 [Aquilegia coerulea]